MERPRDHRLTGVAIRQVVLATLSVYLLVAQPALAQSAQDEIRCAYLHRNHCSSSGCVELPAGNSFLIVPALQYLERAATAARTAEVVVRRCDDQGCTPVNVLAARSGEFINLAGPRSGYQLKLATSTVELFDFGRGDFVEVASQNLGVYIGHGVCRFPR